MIKTYEYFKNGGLKKKINNYNYETKLGKKGSKFLNSLKESNTKVESEENSEFDIAFYDEYEPDRSLFFTKKGWKKIKEFFNENIYDLLPESLQFRYDIVGELFYNIEKDYYGLTEITLGLMFEIEKDFDEETEYSSDNLTSSYDRENDKWKYYETYKICTICHEVIVK